MPVRVTHSSGVASRYGARILGLPALTQAAIHLFKNALGFGSFRGMEKVDGDDVRETLAEPGELAGHPLLFGASCF
jgi:hypothetical protein